MSELIRVPLPGVQTYNEQGEIVDMPPIVCNTHFPLWEVERKPAPSLALIPLVIDPTLPKDTIRVGNVTLTGIGDADE